MTSIHAKQATVSPKIRHQTAVSPRPSLISQEQKQALTQALCEMEIALFNQQSPIPGINQSLNPVHQTNQAQLDSLIMSLLARDGITDKSHQAALLDQWKTYQMALSQNHSVAPSPTPFILTSARQLENYKELVAQQKDIFRSRSTALQSMPDKGLHELKEIQRQFMSDRIVQKEKMTPLARISAELIDLRPLME